MRSASEDFALGHNFVLVESDKGAGIFRRAFDLQSQQGRVTVDTSEATLGRIVAFSEIGQPTTTMETKDLRSFNKPFPTPVATGVGSYTGLSLTRAVFPRNGDMYAWMVQCVTGAREAIPRRDFSVYQLDNSKSRIIVGYRYMGCIATEMTPPSLTSGGGVSVESIVIKITRMERVR